MVLVLPEETNSSKRQTRYSGNEIASLFMKHTSTKLQAGTHKVISKFVNKFAIYTSAGATSGYLANLSTLTIGVQGLYTLADL